MRSHSAHEVGRRLRPEQTVAASLRLAPSGLISARAYEARADENHVRIVERPAVGAIDLLTRRFGPEMLLGLAYQRVARPRNGSALDRND